MNREFPEEQFYDEDSEGVYRFDVGNQNLVNITEIESSLREQGFKEKDNRDSDGIYLKTPIQRMKQR